MPPKRKRSPARRPTPKVPKTFRVGLDRVAGNYNRYGATTAGKELKYFDVDGSVAAPTTDDWRVTENTIVNIKKGDGASERIGRHITVKYIDFKFLISGSPQQLADDGESVGTGGRGMMFVLDKQCNGAAAGVTDILDTADFWSFKNLSNSKRFHTYKRIAEPRKAGMAAYNGTTPPLTVWFEPGVWEGQIACNCKVTYDTTSGDIDVTNIITNNILLLTAGSAEGNNFDYNIRVRYLDD